MERHEGDALVGDQLGEVLLQRAWRGLAVAECDRVLLGVEGLPGSGRAVEDDIGGFVHRGGLAGGRAGGRCRREVGEVDAEASAQVRDFRIPVGDVGERYGDDTGDFGDVDGHGRQPVYVANVLVSVPGGVEIVVRGHQSGDIELRAGLAGEDDVPCAHLLGEEPAHEREACRLLGGIGAFVELAHAFALEGPVRQGSEGAVQAFELASDFRHRRGDAAEFHLALIQNLDRLGRIIRISKDGAPWDTHVEEVKRRPASRLYHVISPRPLG